MDTAVCLFPEWGIMGTRRKAFKAAFPNTIPVMTGYVFLGITYGMLMATSGFPAWLPVVTALIIYTGVHGVSSGLYPGFLL